MNWDERMDRACSCGGKGLGANGYHYWGAIGCRHHDEATRILRATLTPSRLPLQRACNAMPGGLHHPDVEVVARAIGDAMSDAFLDAEEIVAAAGHANIADAIRRRRLALTGQRSDTRRTSR